ncbi:MAG: SMP-30/gluconolactonase/LRE family protein [Leptolyngbyaceae cyanobacterium]
MNLSTVIPKSERPRNVLATRARLGEGPVWDEQQQRLHWVDIYNRRIHTYDPAKTSASFIEVDSVVSGLFIDDAEHLIIAEENGLSRLNLLTHQREPIVSIEADRPNNRLNDVRCDCQGRLWIGTMNNDEQPQASLYRFDPNGSLHKMETDLSISNGLGWNPDQSAFYLTDSPRQLIYAYRFEAESGTIGDRTVLIDLTAETFFPDGLTIDSEGCIWSAMWNGGCVIRFNPDGQEIDRIALPVPLVTSCTFGGPDLADLYITTASAGMSQAELKQYHEAGDLFCLPTSVRGLPSERCSLRC